MVPGGSGLILIARALFFAMMSVLSLRAAVESAPWIVSVRQGVRVSHADCDAFFEKYGTPRRVQCVVDVPGEAENCAALLGISEDAPCTGYALYQGLERCAKQRRYDEIELSIKDDALHCVFRLADSVDSIHISGAIIGRDRYRYLYRIKPGDIFDAQHHADGIAAVRAALFDDGYCAATVRDELIRKEDTHAVVIRIIIEAGDQYHIDSVAIDFKSNEASDRAQRLLERSIKKRLSDALLHGAYNKASIDHEVEGIRSLLIDEGYMAPKIAINEAFFHDAQSVALTCTVDVSGKKSFVFDGNSHLPRRQLIEHIMRFGSSVALIPGSFFAEEIEQLYRDQGFWQASVAFHEDATRWYFFITEGKRSIVREVELRGVSLELYDEMLKVVGKHIVRSKALTMDALRSGMNAMMQRYLECGFWDARCLNHEIVPISPGAVRVVLHVAEGPRKYLARVELDIPALCAVPALVQEHQTLSAPIPFDIRFIQSHKRALRQQLASEGRIRALPYPELSSTPEGEVLAWHVKGDSVQIRFGKTIIRGNGRISQSIILRERAYCEGDIWNGALVDRTVARLRGLGLFESVVAVPDEAIRDGVWKDVIIQAVPDTRYEIRARGGFQGVNRNLFLWNGGASYKCGGSFLMRNPGGYGDIIRCDVDFSRYMHDVNLVYRVPRLWGNVMRTECKIFSHRYDQPLYVGSPEVLYRMQYAGGLVGLGYWEGMENGGISGGLAVLRLRAASCTSCSDQAQQCGRRNEVIKTLSLNPQFFEHYIPYLTIEGSALWNHVDNPVDPHKGTLTVASLKLMVPPSMPSGVLAKGIVEHSCFASWGLCVLAMRLRAGIVAPASFSSIPPSERFYLGGSHSVRSYEADYAPPLQTFTTCSGTSCLVPIGGGCMANCNFEFRFPLYRQLHGVVFMDGGTLSQTGPHALLKPQAWSGAVGCGLRIHTIIGPLRFDIGWKVPPSRSAVTGDRVDRSYAWFMTLGHAF